MCLKTPKVPKPPTVQAAPQRDTVDTGEQRRKVTERSGVFGNIFTSALGDTQYGQNARKVATLGGAAA